MAVAVEALSGCSQFEYEKYSRLVAGSSIG
jgi:hypothetical protein